MSDDTKWAVSVLAEGPENVSTEGLAVYLFRNEPELNVVRIAYGPRRLHATVVVSAADEAEAQITALDVMGQRLPQPEWVLSVNEVGPFVGDRVTTMLEEWWAQLDQTEREETRAVTHDMPAWMTSSLIDAGIPVMTAAGWEGATMFRAPWIPRVVAHFIAAKPLDA